MWLLCQPSLKLLYLHLLDVGCVLSLLLAVLGSLGHLLLLDEVQRHGRVGGLVQDLRFSVVLPLHEECGTELDAWGTAVYVRFRALGCCRYTGYASCAGEDALAWKRPTK